MANKVYTASRFDQKFAYNPTRFAAETAPLWRSQKTQKSDIETENLCP